jgi:hypothetical protein
MAYARTAITAHGLPFTRRSSAPTGPSLLSRLFASMTASRARQAEREVARYLADTGGKFTDEAEREIERRFLSNQSHW